MTGGGGFLVCLLSLALTLVSSQLRTCDIGYQWMLNGKNVLENSPDDVTVVLLLRLTSLDSQRQVLSVGDFMLDLRAQGYPVSFVVVNSKEARFNEQLKNFEKQFSFPVYQESESDKTWKTVEGSDSKVFIYDRCGRLTHFAPFPVYQYQYQEELLNDLHREIRESFYSTDPCAVTCRTNALLEIIEKQTNAGQDVLNGNPTELETDRYPSGTGVLIDVEDDFPILGNGASGERETVDDYKNETYSSSNNTTASNDATENSNFVDDQNSKATVSPQSKESLFSKFLSFIFGDGKPKQQKNNTEEKTVHPSLPSYPTNDIQIQPVIPNYTSNFDQSTAQSTSENADNLSSTKEDRKVDSCAGVDNNVCRDWSKRKMLHAQMCCAAALQNPVNHRGNGCDHFGKKRCKKIQPLLKCCLKNEIHNSAAASSTVATSTGEPVATKQGAEQPGVM